jgi:hypothetical protein
MPTSVTSTANSGGDRTHLLNAAAHEGQGGQPADDAEQVKNAHGAAL